MGGIRSVLGTLVSIATVSAAIAQQAEEKVTVRVWKPEMVEPTKARIDGLRAPRGFKVAKFAEGLGHPRLMAVAPDGSVYVTRNFEGDVVRLKDADGDGRAEVQDSVLNLKDVHGICLHEDKLYLTTIHEVHTVEIGEDGKLAEPKMVLDKMPDGGQHPRRTIAIGPDNRMYVSIGSTCNACNETNPEHASIIRAGLDGSGRAVYAQGLRNTLAFGWHPRTGTMYGVDQGTDDLGDKVPSEELNVIEQGKHYGWPHVYDDGKINPAPPLLPGMTKEQLVARNTSPVLGYTAHASPIAIVFAGDSLSPGAPAQDNEDAPRPWPEEYRDDAFVTFRGSWNAYPPAGYEIVRLKFRDGKPAEFESFISGFIEGNGKECFARPAGLAWARDGSLLMSDDTNGVIYRIWYTGKNDGDDPLSGPDGP